MLFGTREKDLLQMHRTARRGPSFRPDLHANRQPDRRADRGRELAVRDTDGGRSGGIAIVDILKRLRGQLACRAAENIFSVWSKQRLALGTKYPDGIADHLTVAAVQRETQIGRQGMLGLLS